MYTQPRSTDSRAPAPTATCPPRAADVHTSSVHRQSCSRAHFNISRCALEASGDTSTRPTHSRGPRPQGRLRTRVFSVVDRPTNQPASGRPPRPVKISVKIAGPEGGVELVAQSHKRQHRAWHAKRRQQWPAQPKKTRRVALASPRPQRLQRGCKSLRFNNGPRRRKAKYSTRSARIILWEDGLEWAPGLGRGRGRGWSGGTVCGCCSR